MSSKQVETALEDLEKALKSEMSFEWKPLHDLILHFLCDKNAVRLTADSESEISTIDIFRHYTKWVKIHYFGVEKRTQKEFDDGLQSVVDSRLEAPFVYLVGKGPNTYHGIQLLY